MIRNNLISTEFPNRIAIIKESGETVTYASLLSEIGEISKRLCPNKVIFIVGNNDYTALLYYLAAFENHTVPLLLSSELSQEALSDLIERYSPSYLLIDSKESAFTGFDIVTENEGYTLYQSLLNQHAEISLELGFLATTSGSTGAPKLVRYSRENILHNTHSISDYLGIQPDDRAIAHLPIHYSFGFSIINSHLYSGASFLLTSKSIFDKEFWSDINTHKVTSFSGVPFHFESLLRMRFNTLSLPSLKHMTQAGGRLAPEKMKLVVEACQEMGICFWTMYGQTEASPRISYLRPDKTLDKLGSIGQAVPNGKLWIRGEDGEDISSSSKVGELIYEGGNVCLGYAENASDFNLGDDNHGVLATGDLAYSDDEGFFFLQGRKSRFVKVYGKRISLEHIEELLHKRGYECIAGGRDDKLIVGIITDQEIDTKQIRKQIAELASINFVAVQVKQFPEMPRFENGKINYQCLIN